tara:strand:+ start:17 stop:325 length:309 start_codon:yes stop_codon:yes gene_type:complete
VLYVCFHLLNRLGFLKANLKKNAPINKLSKVSMLLNFMLAKIDKEDISEAITIDSPITNARVLNVFVRVIIRAPNFNLRITPLAGAILLLLLFKRRHNCRSG